jgi:uncharacterized membrane protein YgcG
MRVFVSGRNVVETAGVVQLGAVTLRRPKGDETMNETFTPTGPPPHAGPRRRQRRRYLLPVAAALLGLAITAAACSSNRASPGVAGSGSTPTTAVSTANQAAPTLTPAQRAAALAYSQCMRSHGVPSFPDPNSQGAIQIQGGPGGALDPNSAAFKNADKACQSKQPKPTAAQQAQAQQHALAVSRCMRAHGIKDYPDPTFSGGKVSMQIQGGPGSDLNPNDPLFAAAQKACNPGAPGRGSGGKTSGSGGSGNVSIGGGLSSGSGS